MSYEHEARAGPSKNGQNPTFYEFIKFHHKKGLFWAKFHQKFTVPSPPSNNFI